MLSKFTSSMKLMTANNQDIEHNNKRQTPRRKCDQCIGEVNGQNFPVEDWSMGGVKIFGDFRTHKVGGEIPITMKFRLRDTILKIPHVAQIIRKTNDGVALQFQPLTKNARTNFQKVIDDYNIREFAGSLG